MTSIITRQRTHSHITQNQQNSSTKHTYHNMAVLQIQKSGTFTFKSQTENPAKSKNFSSPSNRTSYEAHPADMIIKLY